MLRILTEQDYKTLPWKNGGGVTSELFVIPHTQDQSKFLFRLSIALVSKSGPFSHFPEIDRSLYLLSGNGMKLHFKNGPTVPLEKALDHIAFLGEDDIDCELIDGACTDFNIMGLRSWSSPHVEIKNMKKLETINFVSTNYLFVYVVRGSVLLNNIQVQKNSLIVLSDEEYLNVICEDETSLIVIKCD